jgi:glutathione-regulated potassium-efflux system ancillary protein KefC
MDPLWISIAFVLGFAARQVGLPPLVGFLVAGFVLNAMGVEAGRFLHEFAEMGVTLLLFTIGLKLRLQTLLRPEIWAVATSHMAITVLVFGVGMFALGAAGLNLADQLDLTRAVLIAFALSFSSTVFAVKVLEDKGETGSLHGRIAIGILIMQDIIAVVFLAASTGKIPSPWALGLLLLIPLRPLLMLLMERSGHGELLILYGLLLALGGAFVFELVGMKADLGALILGILLAGHPKAAELYRSLFGIKDLFLVGFFLTIGLYGTPGLDAILLSLVLVAAMALKVVLFFFLLTRFRLRARTSLLGSLSLANYSEFGLIVGAIAVSNQWLSGEWLVVIAVSLSLTFVLAAPLNNAAHSLYAHHEAFLKRFQTRERLPDDQPIDSGDAEIVIFGMGRVGAGAYDRLREQFGTTVLGLDADAGLVEEQRQLGRNVILGDATDPDFWERARTQPEKVRLVLLAMPSHKENLYAAHQLLESGFRGQIAATARYPDEITALEAAGVHAAFNIYAEAGAGFADHVCTTLQA